ncbi:MAG TPA: hypothetical protein VFT50_11820 [Baekduia sp.]|nr:hypothetical protein [Baekduia sp.]
MPEAATAPRAPTALRLAGHAARLAGRLARTARRHAALGLLLVAGAAIRALALIAIYPGIWFSDSNTYIQTAATGILNVNRVMGYSLAVAPFWQLRSAGALIVAQHVLGLAIVVALYALLIHRGAPRWLATLGVVPAALDGYLIVVEHTVMSETVYHATLVAALVLLLWRDRMSPKAAAGAGLLLGYAITLRSVALPFIAVVLLYLLVRRTGWRPIAALAVASALIPLAYMALYDHQHGSFAFTQSGGHFLYTRVAPFADCSMLGDVPADQRAFCPDPEHRLTTTQYGNSRLSPVHGLPPSADGRVGAFARRVVLHQPLDYAGVVVGGVLHYFRPGHPIGHNDYPVGPWQFPADPRRWTYPTYRGPIRPGDPQRQLQHPVTEPNRSVARMVAAGPRLNPAAARIVHRYQQLVYSYGPLLAVCVLVVLAALVLGRGPRRLRLDAALIAVLVLAALTMAQALSVFSYRYGMIAGLLLPVAAALAATALLDRESPHNEIEGRLDHRGGG